MLPTTLSAQFGVVLVWWGPGCGDPLTGKGLALQLQFVPGVIWAVVRANLKQIEDLAVICSHLS